MRSAPALFWAVAATSIASGLPSVTAAQTAITGSVGPLADEVVALSPPSEPLSIQDLIGNRVVRLGATGVTLDGGRNEARLDLGVLRANMDLESAEGSLSANLVIAEIGVRRRRSRSSQVVRLGLGDFGVELELFYQPGMEAITGSLGRNNVPPTQFVVTATGMGREWSWSGDTSTDVSEEWVELDRVPAASEATAAEGREDTDFLSRIDSLLELGRMTEAVAVAVDASRAGPVEATAIEGAISEAADLELNEGRLGYYSELLNALLSVRWQHIGGDPNRLLDLAEEYGERRDFYAMEWLLWAAAQLGADRVEVATQAMRQVRGSREAFIGEKVGLAQLAVYLDPRNVQQAVQIYSGGGESPDVTLAANGYYTPDRFLNVGQRLGAELRVRETGLASGPRIREARHHWRIEPSVDQEIELSVSSDAFEPHVEVWSDAIESAHCETYALRTFEDYTQIPSCEGRVGTNRSSVRVSLLAGSVYTVETGRSFAQPGRLGRYELAVGATEPPLSESSIARSDEEPRDAPLGAPDPAHVLPLGESVALVLPEPGQQMSGLAISDDGARVAVGGHGSVYVWDTESEELRWSGGGHGDSGVTVAFAPGTWRLASAGIDGDVKIWDSEGRATSSMPPRESFSWGVCQAECRDLTSVGFSEDGSFVVAGDASWSVRLWTLADPTSGILRYPVQPRNTAVFVAVSPDGRYVASTGHSQAASVWDRRTQSEVLALRGDTTMAGRVAWGNIEFISESRIAAGMDDRVYVWSFPDGGMVRVIEGVTHFDRIRRPRGLVFTRREEGGHALAVYLSDEDRVVEIANAVEANGGFLVAASADGETIATYGYEGEGYFLRVHRISQDNWGR